MSGSYIWHGTWNDLQKKKVSISTKVVEKACFGGLGENLQHLLWEETMHGIKLIKA